MWAYLAKMGSRGMEECLANYKVKFVENETTMSNMNGEELYQSSVGGFVLSTFFIVLGVVTLILVVWNAFMGTT